VDRLGEPTFHYAHSQAVHGRSAPVLVLTRHANQSIMIGHDVVVTVLDIRGDQVRIGIRAPRDIEVHREEVYEALQQANRAAASPSAEALESVAALRPGGPVAHAAGAAPEGELVRSEREGSPAAPGGRAQPAGQERASRPAAGSPVDGAS